MGRVSSSAGRFLLVLACGMLVAGWRIGDPGPDPRQPQTFMQVLLMKDGFSQFGSPSMLATMQAPFMLADLQPLTVPELAELESATLARLSLPPPRSISSIRLGRGNRDLSSRGNVTIEIRAEDRQFGCSGRVNYELDGRELKAYLP